jgi:hypothetical protein
MVQIAFPSTKLVLVGGGFVSDTCGLTETAPGDWLQLIVHILCWEDGENGLGLFQEMFICSRAPYVGELGSKSNQM